MWLLSKLCAKMMRFCWDRLAVKLRHELGYFGSIGDPRVAAIDMQRASARPISSFAFLEDSISSLTAGESGRLVARCASKQASFAEMLSGTSRSNCLSALVPGTLYLGMMRNCNMELLSVPRY